MSYGCQQVRTNAPKGKDVICDNRFWQERNNRLGQTCTVFSLVIGNHFFLNYFITEEGEAIHEWIGYTAISLICIRLIWGFIGNKNARFVNFLPSKLSIKHHIEELREGKLDPTAGHSPVGALMIFTLLGLIACLGVTGYMMENIDLFWGEEWLEDLHELIAHVTLIAVATHISAIFILQKWTGTELIRPMLSGKRRLEPLQDQRNS